MSKFLYLMCFFTGITFAHEAKENIAVDVLTKTSLSWDGQTLPTYPQGQPEVSILKITIAAKTKLPIHQHAVINAGVLLKGELTVHTEKGETLHLVAGDTIVEVVDKWHYGINEGDKDAEIVVFYAGVQGVTNTITRDVNSGK